MDMLANYEFYRLDYQGEQIPKEKFAGAMRQAQAYLEAVTGREILNHAQEVMVRFAACAVAEAYWEAGQREIQQESAGNWSKSYRQKETALTPRGAAELYLGESGMLFRGCKDR